MQKLFILVVTLFQLRLISNQGIFVQFTVAAALSNNIDTFFTYRIIQVMCFVHI